tara:strand:+ start:1656 stop:2198 length:543 start_codon:yes stop_codon:yes gene_type:complete
MIQDCYHSSIWIKQFDNSKKFNEDVLNTTKAISAMTPKPVADNNVDLWVSDNMKTLRSYFASGFKDLCDHYDETSDFDIDSMNMVNPMEHGDFKSCHNHDVIDAFGVYYVNESDEGGKLRLYDPRFLNKKSFSRGPYVEIKPRTGLMVIAPYYVWHEVTPYLGNETRYSLVCNMVFNNVT